MNEIVYYFAIVSVLTNFTFILLYLKEKKSKKLNKSTSQELNDFILDLMNGEGIVKITRIAPTDIFLRSPRAR